MHDAKSTCEAKLRLALEMFDSGLDLMRQNLRRAQPTATSEEIEKRLALWLRTRPGAEHGDAPGRVRALPLMREFDELTSGS